jgi:hypothetical protein
MASGSEGGLTLGSDDWWGIESDEGSVDTEIMGAFERPIFESKIISFLGSLKNTLITEYNKLFEIYNEENVSINKNNILNDMVQIENEILKINRRISLILNKSQYERQEDVYLCRSCNRIIHRYI